MVDEIAMWVEEDGEVSLGWVKAHMGILGNEAADVCAKQAAEGVPLNDHEKWMSRGGYQAMGEARKREAVVGGGGGYREGDGMEEKGSNKLLQVEGREGYWEMVGEQGRAGG